MTWYLYDNLKVYIGEQKHTAGSPIPSNSTDKSPPVLNDGEYAVFTDGEWVTTTELPQPIPEPIQVPQSITPLQAKLQLLEMELLDEVEAMVATDRKISLYWEYALEIRRDHATLLAMATALGLSDSQVDEMFIEASKLS